MSEIKNIDSLMNYMKDTHNIEIDSEMHKNNLRNMGYYHGFKGYRFIKDSKNTLNFSNFNEIMAMNKLDLDLKSIIYPKIMFIETSIKNRVLESVLEDCKKSDFNSIYEQVLIGYKDYKKHKPKDKENKAYKSKLTQRLRLRDQILSALTREFSKNRKVIEHFYIKEVHVPIWAIFEIITMGELGNFIACLKTDLRKDISRDIKLNKTVDTDGVLLQTVVFLLKDLRNAVAHNNIIFDTRFKTGEVNQQLGQALIYDVKINYNHTDKIFENIFDYIVLIVYLLKGLGMPNGELNRFICDFKSIIEEFRGNINISIYNKIFRSSTKKRIELLRDFVNN